MHSVDKNICHLLQNSHYFATKGSIDDKSSLIKVMAWRQAHTKTSQPVMTQVTDTYMCLQTSMS